MPGAALVGGPAAPGFYGKLPARGDFVGRRLDRGFIDPWDDWLQRAIANSRSELGGRWLELYLTSPIWRFALSPHACGPQAVAGVMIPSVDAVGRYFPLMVGSALGADIHPGSLVTGSGDWYAAVEARILSTLDDGFAFETLEQALPVEPSAAGGFTGGDDAIVMPGWHFPAGPEANPSNAALDGLGRARLPLTIWWTDGSDHVAPCTLICAGLPPAHAFASLLDGSWRERGWMMMDETPDDCGPCDDKE